MESNFSLIPVDFNPFENHQLEKVVQISEPQKEIWASCILGGNEANLAYNLSVSVKLDGTFNFEAFKQTISILISRHEALRATFDPLGEYLMVSKDVPFSLEINDLSTLRGDQQESQIKDFLDTEMSTSFDLLKGPLFRFFLHKKTDTSHLFTLIVHHIIADGWSVGILLQDIAELYSDLVKKRPLAAKNITQISDYNDEEIHFKETQNYSEIEKYWLNTFKSSVPVTDLPTDRPRLSPRSYAGRRYDYRIDSDDVKQLKKLGADADATLVVTLLSGFEILLHKVTGQNEIVIGLPTAGQAATENFYLVGHCVNLLPLKSELDESLSFDEYLRIRKTKFYDDYEHQRITFGELIKKLKLKREDSRIPLVPIMFNVSLGMDTNFAFEGLSHHLTSNARPSETFEIFLNINSDKDAIILEWSYNINLFDSTTISQLNDSFLLLLKTVIKKPNIRISNILLYDKDALIKQTSQWNNTTSYYDKNTIVTKLISETARLYPNRTAVTFKDEKTSYSLLESKSNQLARLLTAKGIKVGDKIGLSLDRSTEMLISLLAIMKAGAAYIPLDPQYPKDRIEYMLADSGAKILITSRDYQDSFKSDATQLLIEDIWAKLDIYDASLPETSVKGRDLAYILYTSGSTGLPKGVQITHSSLVNFLLSMQKEPGIDEKDIVLAITTISFDIAGLELYLPLITGAEIALADTDTARNGITLFQFIKDAKVTIMQATPSTWRMLMDAGWDDCLPIKALCGGEPLAKDLAEKLLKRCSSLWNMYGPTETTIWSTLKEILPTDEIISIGRPIDNTAIFILDKDLNHSPIGSSGEICIGGDGLSIGYLNRPELTSEKFRSTDLLVDGAKIYRTGDLGKFLSNGEIQCLGRIDQQVKLRGHRIELEEIEYHLLKLNGIKEGVVTMREDNPGDQRLVAYVVNGNDRLTKEEIDSWKNLLKEELPYYMIPNDWVVLKKMPLTNNHKVDKKVLPKPEYKYILNEASSRPLKGRSEEMLAKIWSETLKIESVKPEDDFFDLGGHSLIAIKVMMSIEKETGKRLPLASLFENSTLEKLAKLIEFDESDIEWNSLVPIKATGNKPPLYIVHGWGLNVLGFRNLAKVIEDDQPIYGLQAKGLNGDDFHFDSVSETAAHYISEIMKYNPDGPYLVSGYSSGGIIAFEMAKQLKELGKEVPFLAFFDTYTEVSDIAMLKKQKRIMPYINFFYKKLIYSGLFFIRTPKAFLKDKRDFTLGTLYNIYAKFKPKKVIDMSIHENKLLELKWSNDRLMKKYIFTPYDGHAYLFKSNDPRTTYYSHFESNGWAPYIDKGLTSVDLPIGHLDFFKPDFVHHLAAKLHQELAKIQISEN
ncbi:amino acid adenylation domain-containing protein [Pedobacter nyackensis]|uniref:amino acid adenylation domain-containing protein n=1 Tax=Pedobacter nyackensis TaxID=475255 RepID=UPI002931CA2B|nr:amino acid adenylation domain-containing protein [Pedobacter nyackensis]